MPRIDLLELWLGGIVIGWVSRHDGRIGVRFSDEWRAMPGRRTFSLSVEETALADVRATPHLPVWFENLLFEGELRRWMEESEPEIACDDMAFLERIGGDLLGAATVRVAKGAGEAIDADDRLVGGRRPPSGPLHWSLAGVQLKLNVNATQGRYTVPVRGELGHFIAKFSDRKFELVPEVEHATMLWSAAAGIDTAAVSLVDAKEVDEIPHEVQVAGDKALIVKRFDRSTTAAIHAEEFAQALGIRPRDKYGGRGWRRHLQLVDRAFPEDLAEYLRRLVFVAVSGNSDSHHKNWSIVYPDGRRPRLAPAYDQVATVMWAGGPRAFRDALAFKMVNSMRWEDLTANAIVHECRKAQITVVRDGQRELPVEELESWIRVEAARQRDLACVATDRIGSRLTRALQRHWDRMPLMRGD